jgi:hypothetical protein
MSHPSHALEFMLIMRQMNVKINIIKTKMNTFIDFLGSSECFRSHCTEKLMFIFLHGADSPCEIVYIPCCPISSFKNSKAENVIE